MRLSRQSSAREAIETTQRIFIEIDEKVTQRVTEETIRFLAVIRIALHWDY